jgi:major type 1 subunit fimbrin (pilin)
MKKYFYLSLLSLLGATAMPTYAASGTGTINFEGTLTGSTCDADVGGSGSDASIELPVVSISQLTNAGDTAGRTTFTINLTGCSGVLTTASAYFESGASVDPTSGHLTNTGGSATNVSLQLLDGAGSNTVIKAGSTSQIDDTSYSDIQTGSAQLPYAVEYYADDTTTAGNVSSNVVYSIQYK